MAAILFPLFKGDVNEEGVGGRSLEVGLTDCSGIIHRDDVVTP